MDYDERRVAYVAAWIPGRVDKLFVDFTGIEVKKGAPLVWLYSPALYSAQEEYLLVNLGEVPLKNLEDSGQLFQVMTSQAEG